MPEALQIFIYIIGFALIIFVVIFSYMAFVAIKTMQSIKKVADNIDLVKDSLNLFQQSARVGTLALVSKVLGFIKGR